MTDPVPAIRAAATVVVWRDTGRGAQILMGQRGAAAAFMPSKYVFPGGAVDPEDTGPADTGPAETGPADTGPEDTDPRGTAQAGLLSQTCMRRLALHCPPLAPSPRALVGAARRELAEETGLDLHPSARLRFIFRAITPPGRTRRFDARFFLAPARDLAGDMDDFAAASGELAHLHWIGLAQARTLDLPFITEVVISEVTALLAGFDQPGVPFFDNSGATPVFRRLA